MICALFGRKDAFVLVPCLAELTQRRLPKYFLWRAPSAHFDWFQGTSLYLSPVGGRVGITWFSGGTEGGGRNHRKLTAN